MELAGKTVVVTGGASGIGAALVARFVENGARVCVIDRQEVTGPAALSICCDVADEAALTSALQDVVARLGPVDIFVSNAGIMSDQGAEAASASNADWQRCWSVNVMAHVFAARVLVPQMIARGGGRFVVVASAAGLLNQIGDSAYSATKQAAVSFAESLAITHGEEGIGVTLVCPQYVATPLIGLSGEAASEHGSLLTAEDVAGAVLEAVAAGRFLVLPHPQVAAFARRRAEDHDGWIKGMTRLRRKALEDFGDARPERFYRLL